MALNCAMRKGDSVRLLLVYIYLLCLAGLSFGQSLPVKSASTKTRPATVLRSVPIAEDIEPVILTRAALDDKIVTLRVAPRVATSIRLPEPVNSVVVGDPENFQAEHSEHEPALVTVKPVTTEPAKTNVLITTTRGHQVNLLLVSSGGRGSGPEPVDVLLKYGAPAAGSFLIEESAFPSSFIAETRSLGKESKTPESTPGTGTSTTSLRDLVKTASLETKDTGGIAGPALDKLLARQKEAPLPVLYGQHPGQIEAGPRVKAGVSEVLDEGTAVVVLFSVLNPAAHAIQILPPQVQLGGKIKNKWTTAQQLRVIDFRLSARRVGAGQRADGVVAFERPSFKQSNETLFLQVADSGAVDLPALAPIGFGISSFRGGSAYGSR
jgi:hypothetical protein